MCYPKYMDPKQQQPPTPLPTQPTPVAVPKQKEQGPATLSKFPPKELGSVKENPDEVAKQENDEYWEKFSREIELEKKIEELGGIEKVESGEVALPEKEAKEMGIKPTTTLETPIEKATGFSIRNVVLSDDQLSSGLTKPTSTGIRWLVEWFIYQLLKAHYHVKKIKGRIFRSPPVL